MIEIKGQADLDAEMSCSDEIRGFAETESEAENECDEQTLETGAAEGLEAECDPEADEKCEEKETAENEEADSEEEADDKKKAPEKKERKLKWAKKDREEKEEKPDPLAEANEKYLRLFAEFDNFRKRTEKEKSERYDMGARDIIEKILPILDNFERGFGTVEEGDKEDAFVKGMDLVYKQFLKVLEDAGVEPIEALGKEFDPNLHNAVMHVDDPEAGENIIVEEFQKGYTYKGHIVRYSMVKVAN